MFDRCRLYKYQFYPNKFWTKWSTGLIRNGETTCTFSFLIFQELTLIWCQLDHQVRSQGNPEVWKIGMTGKVQHPYRVQEHDTVFTLFFSPFSQLQKWKVFFYTMLFHFCTIPYQHVIWRIWCFLLEECTDSWSRRFQAVTWRMQECS